MSRFMTILVGLIIVLVVFLTARFFKDSFTGSPYSYEEIPPPIGDIPPPEGRDFHNWREFVAPYGHFKVLLPSLPQHVTEAIVDDKTKEVTKYNTFVTSNEKGPVYMVSAITFPNPIAKGNAEEVLKSIVTDMLQRNPDNHLRGMDFGNFRQFQSLNFSLANDQAMIAGKVLLYGDTVYVLSMVDSSESFDNKKLEFFLNSFDLSSKVATPSPAAATSAETSVSPAVNPPASVPR